MMTRTDRRHRRPARRTVMTDEARAFLMFLTVWGLYSAALVLAAKAVFTWLYL